MTKEKVGSGTESKESVSLPDGPRMPTDMTTVQVIYERRRKDPVVFAGFAGKQSELRRRVSSEDPRGVRAGTKQRRTSNYLCKSPSNYGVYNTKCRIKFIT